MSYHHIFKDEFTKETPMNKPGNIVRL